MRVAIYGSIHVSAGSMATSYFAMAREWLRAGHAVDLFSPGAFIEPADLVAFPSFRYFPVGLATWKQATRLVPEQLPRIARSAARAVLSEVQRKAHEAGVARAILDEHARDPYDAVVVLNALSRLPIPLDVVPVISFVQGSNDGELDFVRRRGELVRDECGATGWAAMRAGYEAKTPRVVASMARSTFLVAPSAWTASRFELAGWPRDRIAVVWPAVDVARFAPTTRPATEARFTFLWLGRIVPRKRFQLALDALALLRSRRPGARLIVIGSAGYAGMIAIRVPPFGDGVERGEPVPNDRVPELMARTDVLLQPSENENFGMSCAEAAACGVPSVVGPTNGTADALEDVAYRFDRYEVEAVAGAMERAMDAILADRDAVARRARAVAEKNLSLATSAARAADLIRDVSDGWRAERGVTPASDRSRRA